MIFASRASSVFLAAFIALAWPHLARAQAQSAPPRSTADILAILDEHRPDPAKLNRLREIVARKEPPTADPLDQAKFYIERGRAAGELGMLQRQLEDLRKGLELMPENDPERYYVSGELLGMEFRGGDYGTAVKMYERAPFEAKLSGQRMSAWALLAVVRAQTGNAAGARDALSNAESQLAALQYKPDWATYSNVWRGVVERARALTLRTEGKFADAEITLKRSIALYEGHLQYVPSIIARGLYSPSMALYAHIILSMQNNNLLPILLERGKLAEAELLARDSLKRALGTFGRYSTETAVSLTQLSQVVSEQGRFAESIVLARAAVEIYERLGVAPYSRPLALARHNVGAALVEEGKYTEAAAVFEEAARGLHQSPTVAETGERGENTAWIYALIRIGRAAEAVKQAANVHEYQLRIVGPQSYSIVEARGFVALALAANGQRDEALREFRAAIPALLAAASERSGEEGLGLARARRLTRILEAYIALLGQLAAEGASLEGLDPAAEAFRIADVARASTVQRALAAASARAAIRDPELAKLAREEQDAAHRIGALTGIIVELLARPPDKHLPSVIAKIREDIDALRKKRAELKQGIEKRFPDYANLIDPKPVPLELARRMLAPDEAMIVLYGTEDKTFVWALPKEGRARFHAAALGRGERDAIVTRLRRAMDVGSRPLELFPAYDVALAHKLYEALLAPVEGAWGSAKSLLIVPHASLGQLPFSTLVSKPGAAPQAELRFDGYKQAAWLVQRAAITQLPSVNTLYSLRSVARARAPYEPFAGFGDPVFRKEQLAAAGTGLRGLRFRSAAFEDAQAARRALSVQLSQLTALPDTAEELEGIAKALGAAPEHNVFLGPKASEQAVKSADLSGRRVVAFATHGLVPGDLDGLTQPALALSNPQVTGEKDSDGLLTMEEILGLKLNADWVVLSACNTASAGDAGEEAVSGLGRAFFYAGARALLVSNWPVESVSAKLLITDIFRRQAADPKLGRAEALRQAMLHLMQNETAKDRDGKPLFSYAHPMFWAPFSLVGDGGGN